jgi:hypothetical protein
MVGRWIVRGLALTLLVMCVAAWVGSYWEAGIVERDLRDGIRYLVLEGGAVTYVGDALFIEANDTVAWKWRSRRTDMGLLSAVYSRLDWRFAGFAAGRYPVPEGHRIVVVPLWCVVLPAAGLLWWVWRKTRPRFNGRGFPVEPVGGKEAGA